MNIADFMELSLSPDQETLRKRLISATQALDFGLFAANIVTERIGRRPFFTVMNNAPRNFLAAWDNSIAIVDPVLTRLRKSRLPFFYDQAFYLDADAGVLWEQAAPFGYKTGLCSSVRIADDKVFVFGVDRCDALPHDQRHLTSLFAKFNMLAVHCAEASQRVLLNGQSDMPTLPKLSRRELEVLGWTLEGKTAFQVGEQLNIAERTVNQHIQSAMRKLQARDKHQAAIRALRWNLIR